MNVVRMVLEGDLGQAEKLIAIALVLGVPVTGIGLAARRCRGTRRGRGSSWSSCRRS
jgi:hypothetical protein